MNVHEVQELFGKVVNAQKANDDTKALKLLDDLLLKAPKFMAGWNQRGALLNKLGAHFDALLNFEKAITLEPTHAPTYSNRGAVYLSLGHYEKALDDFNTAIKLNPNIAQVWNNKANTYRRMVRIPEAVECYRRAIQADKDYCDAHLGLGMSLLELQEFHEGWSEYEWRFKSDQMPPRKLSAPRWDGRKCPTYEKLGALLIWGEQGFGDILQFSRYIKFAKEKWGGLVCVEVRLPMARLIRDIEGVDKVIVLGEQIPSNVVAQIPMMSVPSLVGTEKGFGCSGYIKVDPGLKNNWNHLLSQLPKGLRVGLCWAGMNREENLTASAIDARRSLTLPAFAPIARVKNVVLFSLQKGAPAEQIKMPPAGMMIADLMPETQDFADTAALISHLDLVITVDTAVAHVAAGVGVPTWMLSRFDGCWRWFGDRQDSPWYPSLTQFRQKKEGEWDSVIEDVWRNLQRFVLEHQAHAA